MRIVNLETFLKFPENTIFSSYRNGGFGKLCIKLSTRNNGHFEYTTIADDDWHTNSLNERIEHWTVKTDGGDTDQWFAVLNRVEVMMVRESIMGWLDKCLQTAYLDNFTPPQPEDAKGTPQENVSDSVISRIKPGYTPNLGIFDRSTKVDVSNTVREFHGTGFIITPPNFDMFVGEPVESNSVSIDLQHLLEKTLNSGGVDIPQPLAIQPLNDGELKENKQFEGRASPKGFIALLAGAYSDTKNKSLVEFSFTTNSVIPLENGFTGVSPINVTAKQKEITIENEYVEFEFYHERRMIGNFRAIYPAGELNLTNQEMFPDKQMLVDFVNQFHMELMENNDFDPSLRMKVILSHLELLLKNRVGFFYQSH